MLTATFSLQPSMHLATIEITYNVMVVAASIQATGLRAHPLKVNL